MEKSFATILRELRKSRDLSQGDLAKALSVHQTAVSQWETGRTMPDIDTITQVARYFNVSTDYLLGRDDDPNPSAPPPATKDIDDIRFALFGDVAEEITDEDMEDVRLVVELIKRRKQDKKEGR